MNTSVLGSTKPSLRIYKKIKINSKNQKALYTKPTKRMPKLANRASPTDMVGPRTTLLDFLKKNFMYLERPVGQIKKVIPHFTLEKFKQGDVIRKFPPPSFYYFVL